MCHLPRNSVSPPRAYLGDIFETLSVLQKKQKLIDLVLDDQMTYEIMQIQCQITFSNKLPRQIPFQSFFLLWDGVSNMQGWNWIFCRMFFRLWSSLRSGRFNSIEGKQKSPDPGQLFQFTLITHGMLMDSENCCYLLLFSGKMICARPETAANQILWLETVTQISKALSVWNFLLPLLVIFEKRFSQSE